MASAMTMDPRARTAPSQPHQSTSDALLPTLHTGSFTPITLSTFDPKFGSPPLLHSQIPNARRQPSITTLEQIPDEHFLQMQPTSVADVKSPKPDDVLLDDIPFIDPTFDRSDAPSPRMSPIPATASPPEARPTSSQHNYAALPPGAAPASRFAGAPLVNNLRQSSAGSPVINGVAPAHSSTELSLGSASAPQRNHVLSTPPSSLMPPGQSPPSSSPLGVSSSTSPPAAGPRHPAMVSIRSAPGAKRTTPVPASAPPPRAYGSIPAIPGTPGIVNFQDLVATERLSPQAPSGAAPPRKREEEVCIECMMRDRDMADVDVTGPGVWARDSDADFLDLVRRDKEEDERTYTGQSSSSSHSSRPRVRSRGGKLTEENVRKWLLMNPRDHDARWRALTKFVKGQNALLQVDLAARSPIEAEQRAADLRLRDGLAQLCQPGFDVDEGNVRARVPPPSSAGSGHTPSYFGARHDADNSSLPATPGRVLARDDGKPAQLKRDATSFENGMPHDVIDMSDVGWPSRSRSRRRPHTATPSRDDRTSVYDRGSIYSSPSARLGPPPFVDSPSPSPRPSVDALGRRSRFFGGWRQSLAGSMISLAPSRASVVNLHGMNMDRERFTHSTSTPALLDKPMQPQEWPRVGPTSADVVRAPSEGQRSKKGKGMSRLLRIFTSKQSRNAQSNPPDAQPQRAEDDLSAPLPPPPSMSYLVNRTSLERQTTHTRALSTPSLATPSPSQQRLVIPSPGIPSQSRPSPPTAPSSVLPSPTSVRFSWRGSNMSVDKMTSQDRLDFPSLGTAFEDVETQDPAAFEAELKRRQMLHMPVINEPRRHVTPGSTPGTPRPHTVFLTDKSLPPLPAEAESEERYRRQSLAGFGGAPPTPAMQERSFNSMGRAAGARALVPERPRRVSAGNGQNGSLADAPVEARRRSRFGLGALLGRKDKDTQERRSKTEPMMTMYGGAYPLTVGARRSMEPLRHVQGGEFAHNTIDGRFTHNGQLKGYLNQYDADIAPVPVRSLQSR